MHLTSLVCFVGCLRAASMFVEVSVHGVLHSRCFADTCVCWGGGEVQRMLCKLIFLVANAGLSPKVSKFIVKLELSSWLKLTSCPSAWVTCRQSSLRLKSMECLWKLQSHIANVHKQGMAIITSSLNLKPSSVNKSVIFILCLHYASHYHRSHPESS